MAHPKATAGAHRSRLWSLLPLLFFVPALPAQSPQSMTEDAIKAGFLFNFTRFVEWPESTFSTPASPFTVCVFGVTPVASLLEGATTGRSVASHPIVIRTIRPADDLRLCQLVFVDAIEDRHTPRILDSLKSTNALTVGETVLFRRSGGAINFVVQENKVKLELNLNAASAAGLRVSAKLIAVSHLVQPGRD